MFTRNSGTRIPVWAYGLLVIVLIVLALYIIGRIHSPADGVGFKEVDGQFVITAVSSGSAGEDAGLKPGDIILSIENQDLALHGYTTLLEQYRAGEKLNYRILREGGIDNVQLELRSLWSKNKWFYIAFYTLIFIVSTTSFYIIYRKPNDRGAKLFFIFIQLFAIAQNHSFLYINTTYATIASIFFIIGFNLYGVVLIHFNLVFPVKVSFYNRIKKLIRLLYFTGFLFAIAISLLMIWRYRQDHYFVSLIDGYSQILLRWMGVTLFLALLIAFYQYRQASNNAVRKQLRLVLVGSLFGLIPPIFFSLFPEFVIRLEQKYNMMIASEMINGAGTYIMTSFLALAIFRYRLWNIQFIFRKALLYIIATLLIYSIYFISIYLVQVVFNEETNLIQFIFLSASILIVMLLRDPIKRAIDKFFYLELYDTTKVILAFEKQFSSVYNIETLNKGIADFLDSVLHFNSCIFAIKEEGQTYKIVKAVGLSPKMIGQKIVMSNESESLIKESKVISIEELSIKPVQFDLVQGEILVPLSHGSESFGFFVLGRKYTNKSYTLQDVRLLSMISRRIISLYKTAMLYQLDIDQHLMLERERARIARDIHDDIGASLTRVSIISELIMNKLIKKNDLKKWLNTIAETSREVVSEMTQIIWTISPQNDTFEGLFSYIRRYSNEYLEPTNISCSFQYPNSMNSISLRAEKRRNIFLCVREALHNIVKHSCAEKVWISFTHEKSWIKIAIVDNGKGFDPCVVKTLGNGLINIKDRLKSIGGKTRIASKDGNGTEVLLFIPLTPKINEN